MLWQAQSIRTGKEDSKFHLFIFIHSNKRHWHFVVVSSSGETQIQKTQKNISAKSQLILYWPLQVWTLMVIRFILFYFMFLYHFIIFQSLLNIYAPPIKHFKGRTVLFPTKKTFKVTSAAKLFFCLKVGLDM